MIIATISTAIPRLLHAVSHGIMTLPAPIATAGALADDALPTMAEVMHWSGRVSDAGITAAIAIGIALGIHALVFGALRRIARRARATALTLVMLRCTQAVRWALVALAVALASATNPLLRHLWASVEIVLVPALAGWLALAVLRAFADVLEHQMQGVEDPIAARAHHTRIALLSRSLGTLIIMVTAAIVMLKIPAVRQVGATLIASAGLLGLAVGAAAQPALKSLIAGLQIAFTQPIRLGDFVVFEGESGRVEDIRFSYVVIRSADERRLIVPTVKFLDAPFQNWTRVGGITGIVLLPIRPGFAIAPIRAAFEGMIAKRPEWDGRTATLEVAEARVGAVELKLYMSAVSPAELAILRPAIREAMLEWLRAESPEALCREAIASFAPPATATAAR